ncbi:MAG: xanthine dehydrogenase family protein molybdopterin-binding subunit [Candidatus Eisenbacteria bacterium]|nr:xanthine dehydrogenase family protein molybdopterin-binding subunit [Candidatus Eisenbacteria bacterium]
MTVIGRRVKRSEGVERVTGAGLFTDDLNYPGMLHAAVVRSPVARGLVQGIDTGSALNMKGVEGVFTFRDIPGRNSIPIILDDQPFLAEKYVNYVGEPIAVVVACDRPTARAAALAVEVTIKKLPPILSLMEARNHPTIKLFGEDNVFRQLKIRRGDTKRAFASCDVIVENEYRTPYQEHAYIEPLAMIAIPHPDGRMEIRGSMQCPFYVRNAVTRVLALPESDVWVIQTATGGAFGGKEDVPSLLACQAALPAWKLKRPIKLVYDRTEDMMSSSKRHPSWVRYKSGASKDGTLKAVKVEYVIDGGAYSTLSPAVLFRGTVHAAGPYRCENVKVDSYVVATNKVPTGAFRGFGSPQILFAAESQMDILAEKLGLDPVEFRRRNLLRVGDTTATGQRLLNSVGLEETLDKVLQSSAWCPRAKERADKDGGKDTGKARRRDEGSEDDRIRNEEGNTGFGLSTIFYGVGLGAAGKYLARTGANVILHSDGSVLFSVGTTELGQGMTTVLSQIVADGLGVPFECVRMTAPDTSRVPDSGPTVASRSTTMSGNALNNACRKIKDVLVGEASEMLGCPADQIRMDEGVVTAGGSLRDATLRSAAGESAGGLEGKAFPETKTSLSINDVIKSCVQKRKPLSADGWYASPPTNFDNETGQGDAYVVYAWATNLVKARVDRETGEVSVLKVWSAHDVGKAINPSSAEGQIEGGVLQGIGYALTEDMSVDSAGRILNPDFSTYIIPTAEDGPEIVSIIVEHPYPEGPDGAKGFAEQPLMGIAPAVANAVYDAVGVRITDLPLTPEKVWRALKEKETHEGKRGKADLGARTRKKT